MRTLKLLVCGALAVVCASGPSVADWGKAGYDKGFRFESEDKKNTMRISSRVQIRFTNEDPEAGDDKASFRIRRFKFKLDGKVYEHWKYKLQVNFVGNNDNFGDPDDTDLLLEDAWFQYTKHRWVQPWLGQGKAWFSRQALTSSGSLQMVDRFGLSQANVPRQIGIGLVGKNKGETFEYNAGLYNGEGVNQKENENNEFLSVFRAVWTPFGSYEPAESALDRPQRSKLALGVAGAFNKREATGTDPKLAIDRYAFEGAYKIHGFSAVAEYFMVEQDPTGGPTIDTDVWYAQAGFLLPNMPLEFAGRYGEVDPDTPDVAEERFELSEKGVAVSYYFARHAYKVQADFRRLENDTVAGMDEDQVRVQFQLAF